VTGGEESSRADPGSNVKLLVNQTNDSNDSSSSMVEDRRVVQRLLFT